MKTANKTDLLAFAVALAAAGGAHLLFPDMHWGIKAAIGFLVLGATLAGIKETLATERQAEHR